MNIYVAMLYNYLGQVYELLVRCIKRMIIMYPMIQEFDIPN